MDMGGHQWCLPHFSVLTAVLSEADTQTLVHDFAKDPPNYVSSKLKIPKLRLYV